MSEFERIIIPILVVLGAICELCFISIAIDINAIKKNISKMQRNSNAKNETLKTTFVDQERR